jgi:ABC-type uncharacterized transport system substrate-binding protein
MPSMARRGYRWGEGRAERYADIADEFVRLKVNVIVTSGSAVVAVKRATSVIPIVFPTANEPVGSGLVASLARPGGNATGLSMQQTDLAGKRLGLLREIVPGLRRLGGLINASNPGAALDRDQVRAAASTLGLEVVIKDIQRAEEIAPAFEAFKGRTEALYVVGEATNRIRINTLALAARLPSIFPNRAAVEAGGLVSYGPNFPDLYRRAGDYVDKILRGANPAEIPVEQPTKFDLVINLTTAKALGLTVPMAWVICPPLLSRRPSTFCEDGGVVKLVIIASIRNYIVTQATSDWIALLSFESSMSAHTTVRHLHADPGLGTARQDCLGSRQSPGDPDQASFPELPLTACTAVRHLRSDLAAGKEQQDCLANSRHRDERDQAFFP